MKKIIVLLSICILFVTGCQIVKLDSSNIEENIDTLMSKKVKNYNIYYEGYKYYLPKGLTFLDKEDFNAVLKDNNNNKYYFYVDVISYYHKISNDYEENKDSYYSKRLDYNNKDGYIQIDEVDSKYFVQFVFHYAKMEAYIEKDDLITAIQYMCSVLRTVKYNNKVLESIVGTKVLDYKEENYTLFKADSSKESFLDVVEREETDQYKKDLEDEKIDLDN
jgi:hypothetical protein